MRYLCGQGRVVKVVDADGGVKGMEVERAELV
jgi:hypothetical protein